MGIVCEDSLAETIEALNDVFFYRRTLTDSDRLTAALWIAARHARFGAFANMFAPTPHDFEFFQRVYTGEKLATKTRTAHILGEEACRVLILLRVGHRAVTNALEEATAGMLSVLEDGRLHGEPAGTYCCGTCTCALWRHLAAGSLAKRDQLLEMGVAELKSRRDGEGRWVQFPFYYTLLALSEMDLPSARAELSYAASACERSLRRLKRDDRFTRRRRALIARVLENAA